MQDKRAAYDRYGKDFERMRYCGFQRPAVPAVPDLKAWTWNRFSAGGGARGGSPQFEGGFGDF